MLTTYQEAGLTIPCFGRGHYRWKGLSCFSMIFVSP